MTMPSFLVIGAMKSGTTALYWYLSQHPDVFMPRVKEPHYFALAGQRPRFRGPDSDQNINMAITDRAAYERLFDATSGRRAIGEASPTTLYFAEAAERIAAEVPGVRMIAILRQPADRAYSAYLHLKRDGYERARDFAEGLRLEPERIRDEWGPTWRYRDAGYYGAQLSRFYGLFSREQIRVYLHEDLAEEPLRVIQDAYAFIGVDPAFVPDLSQRPNVSGIPPDPVTRAFFGWRSLVRSRVVPLVPGAVRQRIRGTMARRLVRPALDARSRAELTREFSADIQRVSSLTGLDLSAWREPDDGRRTASDLLLE